MKNKLTQKDRLERFNKELCSKIQSGDTKAQEILIRSSKGLVLSCAKLIEREFGLDINPYGGWDVEDLIQEGYLALIDAALTFNPDAGTKFSTYATEVVKNQMRDVGKRSLATFEKHSVDDGLAHIFLNDSLGDGYKKDYVEEVGSEISVNPHHDPAGDLAVMKTMVLKLLIRLQELPADKRKVLTYRYGFTVREPRTLEVTARHFNKTRAEVKEIEAFCLEELYYAMNDFEVL